MCVCVLLFLLPTADSPAVWIVTNLLTWLFVSLRLRNISSDIISKLLGIFHFFPSSSDNRLFIGITSFGVARCHVSERPKWDWFCHWEYLGGNLCQPERERDWIVYWLLLITSAVTGLNGLMYHIPKAHHLMSNTASFYFSCIRFKNDDKVVVITTNNVSIRNSIIFKPEASQQLTKGIGCCYFRNYLRPFFSKACHFLLDLAFTSHYSTVAHVYIESAFIFLPLTFYLWEY